MAGLPVIVVLTTIAETHGWVTQQLLRIADTIVELALILLAVAASARLALLNLASLIGPPLVGIRSRIVLAVVALALAGALEAELEADTVLLLAVSSGAGAVDVARVHRCFRARDYLDGPPLAVCWRLMRRGGRARGETHGLAHAAVVAQLGPLLGRRHCWHSAVKGLSGSGHRRGRQHLRRLRVLRRFLFLGLFGRRFKLFDGRHFLSGKRAFLRIQRTGLYGRLKVAGRLPLAA